MHKIDIATAQDLDEINNLRSAIRASFTNYDLGLEDIKQSGKRITFITRNSGQIVGYLSLHSSISFQTDNKAVFEVGIHPDYEGERRATDLVKRAIQYTQEKTNLRHVEALVKKSKPESEGMLKKIGFRVLHKDDLGSTLVIDIQR